MPRPNRFHIPFNERLRQSRVARGLESEPAIPELVAPAPQEPSLYEALEAAMASYASPTDRATPRGMREEFARHMEQAMGRGREMRASNRPSIFQQFWEMGCVSEFRQEAQVADEARVRGNHIHSAIHDEFAAFAARAVQATPPPEPIEERQPVQTQTEQTLITVLQQGVADVLNFIDTIKAKMKNFEAEITQVYVSANGWAHTDIYELTVHHDNATTLCDESTPLVTLDTYSNRKRIYAWGLVMRHSAVVQAIKELPKLNSCDSMRLLEENVIHDYAEFFTENPTTFFAAPGEGQPTNAIPQLQQYSYKIWTRDIPEFKCTPFSPFTPLWKVREAGRVASIYTQLPTEVVEALGAEVMDTYYPHLATKASNAGMIAFTQSATAGMLDRQQVIKPGRFLRQHLPDASDEQIKQYAAECLGALSAGIHHSKDPNEFARVYINGPSSCMAYDERGKQFGRLLVNGEFFHPARVYAHPENNIEIVWVEVAGRIGARAVVNTKTKLYPALYGSDSVSGAHRRLKDYLACLGYEHCDDALDGEKLLRVHTDQGAIICPYIDSGNRGVHIESDCLIVGGSHEANHETGCLHDHDSEDADWYCDDCGDGQDDMDDQYRTNHDETICSGCASGRYTEAYNAGSEEYVWVHDHHDDLFVDQTPGRRGRQIYMGDGHGDYRLLTETHYASGQVAHEDYVVPHEDGDYVLRSDLDRLNLFFNNEIDEACEVEEYAVFDDELVRRSEVPDDAVLCVAENDDDYPMLPVYRSVEEDDQEDAA